MNTAERIRILRREGFSPRMIGAVLGVEEGEIADFELHPDDTPAPAGTSILFERREVVIPVGTDFTEPDAMKIGQFTLLPENVLVEWALWLDHDPGPLNEQLGIFVAPVDDPTDQWINTLPLAQTQYLTRGEGGYEPPLRLDPPDAPRDLGVYLHPANDTEDGLTYSEMTVQLARAAFVLL